MKKSNIDGVNELPRNLQHSDRTKIVQTHQGWGDLNNGKEIGPSSQGIAEGLVALADQLSQLFRMTRNLG